MTKRFENKKTVVRGFIINLANGTSEPFELETDYTRTLEKAAKMLNANAPKGFQYVATELVNEKSEPIVYDVSALVNNSVFQSNTEETAKQYALARMGQSAGVAQQVRRIYPYAGRQLSDPQIHRSRDTHRGTSAGYND